MYQEEEDTASGFQMTPNSISRSPAVETIYYTMLATDVYHPGDHDDPVIWQIKAPDVSVGPDDEVDS